MNHLRLAKTDDIPAIMQIIAQCQALLALRGVDQWQDGYPSQEIIEGDIEAQRGYILEVDSCIAAYSALAFGVEQAYNDLRKGEWITSADEYLTIHRIAIGDTFRGCNLATTIFNIAFDMARSRGYSSVRIDTHKDNMVMQKRLKSLGFTYCGQVIYGVNERIAFEKAISDSCVI